jgi:hypothetical protein
MASAQRMYFARQFGEAQKIFADLSRAHPDDAILTLYDERCELLIRTGAPESWEGVEEIDIR